MHIKTKKKILCIGVSIITIITIVSAILPAMTAMADTLNTSDINSIISSVLPTIDKMKSGDYSGLNVTEVSVDSNDDEVSDNDPVDYEFANPKWSLSNNQAIATWTRSSRSQTYTLKLYWINDGKTSLLTTVSTEKGKYDFSRTIKGNGTGTYYYVLTGSKSLDSLTSERQEISQDQLKTLKNTGNTKKTTVKDYVNPLLEPDNEEDRTLNSEYSKDKNNYNTIDLKDKKSTFIFTPMGYIYYDKEGKIVSNGWMLISDNWYHFKDGFMEQDTWVHNYDGDRYVGKYGKLVVNGVTPDGSKVDAAGRKIP